MSASAAVAAGGRRGLGGKEDRKAWPTSFGPGCFVGHNWLGLGGWAELDCSNQVSWKKKSNLNLSAITAG